MSTLLLYIGSNIASPTEKCYTISMFNQTTVNKIHNAFFLKYPLSSTVQMVQKSGKYTIGLKSNAPTNQMHQDFVKVVTAIIPADQIQAIPLNPTNEFQGLTKLTSIK